MSPDLKVVSSNASNLALMMDDLAHVMTARLKGQDPSEDGVIQLGLVDDGSYLAEFLQARQPSFEEFIVLALALAPHIAPEFLDSVIRAELTEDRDMPELGGLRDADARVFVPTGQTAAFVAGEANLDLRFMIHALFAPDHWFATENILRLEPAKEGAPVLSGRIIMERDWIERLTIGTVTAPQFGADFPARKVSTGLTWDDLILTEAIKDHLGELVRWVNHGETLMQGWGMAGRLRPGYRALFHGPPGTGKTLTASLLGKVTGRDVYRVDLSTVVSKYIGETEKNLASLFDRAENQNWILFFDEADALFGKRTSVKEAHDRYANQEVSYLLQRLEEFSGLVILASNFRANIDDAFQRRFNAIIHFPMPNAEERRQIWHHTLPPEAAKGLDLEHLSLYELTGGNIVNVVQFAALAAIDAGQKQLSEADCLLGIRREMEKEGKVFRPLA